MKGTSGHTALQTWARGVLRASQSPGELLGLKAGAAPTGRHPRGGAGGSARVPVAGIQRHLWLLGRTLSNRRGPAGGGQVGAE